MAAFVRLRSTARMPMLGLPLSPLRSHSDGGSAMSFRVIASLGAFCAWLLLGQVCHEIEPAKPESASGRHDIPGHSHDGHGRLHSACPSGPLWIAGRQFNSQTPSIMPLYPMSVLQVIPLPDLAEAVSLSSSVSARPAPPLFLLHSAFLI